MNYLHLLSSGAILFILRQILAGCGIYHRQRNEFLILITSHKLLFVFKHHFICQKGKEDHLVPTLCVSGLHMQTKDKQNDSYRRLKWKVANLGARPFWVTHVLTVLSEPRARGCSQLVARPEPPRCTQPPGLQLRGWHVGTRQWKGKKKRGLEQVPPGIKKGG